MEDKSRQPYYAYYPKFWYSATSNYKIDLFGPSLRNIMIEDAVKHCRLMAILFDHIAISRIHIANHYNIFSASAVKGFFQHPLIMGFAENSVIVTSLERGDDARSANLFIRDLVCKTKFLLDSAASEMFSITERLDHIEIDNETEANGNIGLTREMFDGYSDTEFVNKYRNLVDSSIEDSLGFYHEKFLFGAKSAFSGKQFDVVWRATNSLYMLTGAPNVPRMYPIYFSDIESRNELSYNGMLRPIYSPQGLLLFFRLLLSPQSLRALLHTPDKKFLDFIRSSHVREAKILFQYEYFEMCRELYDILLIRSFGSVLPMISLNDRRISELIDVYLCNTLGIHKNAAHQSDLDQGMDSSIQQSSSQLIAIMQQKKFSGNNLNGGAARDRLPGIVAMIEMIDKHFK